MIFDKLIITTANQGKFNEFSKIIYDFSHELIFAPEIAELVVEETGKNYAENALLKAKAWAKVTNLPCLADDSGLEVDALNGAPGLFSSRIVPGNDEDKISWLLSQLKGNPNRKARFTASLVLYVPDEYTLITEGHCYGKIAYKPKGNNGFGYDPVFIPDNYDLTFAELDSETKNLISHRKNAFDKIYAHLK